MKINKDDDYMKGNNAMASVLLLYFHIVSQGRIIGDETVFIDTDLFDGYSFLKFEVEKEFQANIDENLIMQGAVIYLLCELNDLILKYGENYAKQQSAQKIINQYKQGNFSAIPETISLFDIILSSDKSLDVKKYHKALTIIYKDYVLATFKKLR